MISTPGAWVRSTRVLGSHLFLKLLARLVTVCVCTATLILLWFGSPQHRFCTAVPYSSFRKTSGKDRPLSSRQ